MERSFIERLSYEFQTASQSHLTGKLEVRSTTGQIWSLYFRLGRLIWATGGRSRFRRWCRLLDQHCPEINLNGSQLHQKFYENQSSLLWEYQVLTSLAKRRQISRECGVAVTKSMITEVLFDILQEAKEVEKITYVCSNQENLEEPAIVVSVQQMLGKAQQLWEAWCNAGLAQYSPNLALVLKRPEELQQSASAEVYVRLTALLRRNATLRELAATLKQDLLLVTRSFAPYIQRGLIELQEAPDRLAPPRSTVEISQGATPKSHQGAIAKSQPLVLCIDDSLSICQTMEQVLTSAGYRFTFVQDSLQALPILLEQKPNLIFLDLVMPVASGYEICAQIRRISAFKDTPVVILTGKDGIVDRVRAKVVGASGFLAKPVESERVLGIVRQFLGAAATAHQDASRLPSQSQFQGAAPEMGGKIFTPS